MTLSVCHVIDNLTQGGAQSLVKDIVVHSPERIDHSVCTLGHDTTLAADFQAAGIDLLPCNGSFRFDPRALYRLFRHLRRGSFDVVHAHLAYAQTFARLLAPLARTGPVVSTYHDAPQTYCRDWHMRLGEKLTRPLDDVSIGVSASVAEGFCETFYFCRFGNISVIDNGVDVADLRDRLASADGTAVRSDLGLSGEELLYLNVGRLAPKKRQCDLIDAMALLDEHSKITLVLVGGGERESNLRRRVAELGLQDSVTVTGRVPEVEPYYAAADVYVHAALYEGWPLTIAEALTADLPLVAPNAPGTRDVVGDAGILVEPRSPKALSEAMRRLVDEDQRDTLSSRSRAQAEKCHIERTVDEYVELYDRVVSRR